MPRTRHRAKGRRDGGAFVPLPCDVLDSEAFILASHRARSLLMDLCWQLRFKSGGAVNNGDLSIAPKILQPRGWTSQDQVHKAKEELIHLGLIILTRQGGLNMPSLYALTWLAIDECDGKLDLAPTSTAPGQWRGPKQRWVPKKSPSPPHGQALSATRTSRVVSR
jgi:hypothetical protein